MGDGSSNRDVLMLKGLPPPSYGWLSHSRSDDYSDPRVKFEVDRLIEEEMLRSSKKPADYLKDFPPIPTSNFHHQYHTIRRQFEIANREAMDHVSAEWRLKYDKEVDSVIKCFKELQVFQESEDASGTNHKLEILQKEIATLLERVETLKRQLQEEKLKRNSQYMN